MRKYLIGVAALVAFTAGCGGGGDESAGATTTHESTMTSTTATTAEANDQDVTFAQMMIQHHQQAVDMAKLAGQKASNPAVKDLARRIEGAQAPEIQQLTGMLERWGAPPPAGMDHSGHGMMTDEQMAELEQSTGADFDRLWLQMMIEHHQGAVTMAETQLSGGGDADAKALAQKIIDAQEAEITEMQGMLG